MEAEQVKVTKTRQNHPDFTRPEYEQGKTPEAGDWYVGYLARVSQFRYNRTPLNGLNYFDGDTWVAMGTPVDKTFRA